MEIKVWKSAGASYAYSAAGHFDKIMQRFSLEFSGKKNT